jgi:hypothetical protein
VATNAAAAAAAAAAIYAAVRRGQRYGALQAPLHAKQVHGPAVVRWITPRQTAHWPRSTTITAAAAAAAAEFIVAASDFAGLVDARLAR